MFPKVSMVIPCYNVEGYLDNTLASICNQEYDNIELIAVDDASTDSTLQILEAWKPKFLQRGYAMSIVRHRENRDVCAGINTGLRLCTGEYLSFPDSDDYLYPEYVSSFVAALEAKPEYGWARCDAEIVNEGSAKGNVSRVPRSSVYKSDFHDFLSAKTPFNSWMSMTRRSYFERCIGTELYDSRLTQEWSLAFPLSFYGAYLRIPKILYRYIKRRNSKAAWRHGDAEFVVRHNLDLKALGLAVLASLPLPKEEMDAARLALELVYGLRMYEAAQKHHQTTAGIEKELSSLIGEIINISDGKSSLRLRIEYALDALLEARPAPLLESLQRNRELFSRGYIIYGAGRIFRYLIDGLTEAFGAPTAVWDRKKQGIFDGIAVSAPDFSFEKLPVVIAVSNSGSARNIRKKLKENGFVFPVGVKEAIAALRGYAIIRNH